MISPTRYLGKIGARKWLGVYVAGSIALAALAASLGGHASAQGQPTPSQTQKQDPTYACSIKVPAGTKDADVAKLAKITDAQARAAAEKAVQGTVVRSEVENENGCAVYGVEIKSADGKVHDVKVDAGTGAVVHQQAGTDGEEAESPDEQEGGKED